MEFAALQSGTRTGTGTLSLLFRRSSRSVKIIPGLAHSYFCRKEFHGFQLAPQLVSRSDHHVKRWLRKNFMVKTGSHLKGLGIRSEVETSVQEKGQGGNEGEHRELIDCGKYAISEAQGTELLSSSSVENTATLLEETKQMSSSNRDVRNEQPCIRDHSARTPCEDMEEIRAEYNKREPNIPSTNRIIVADGIKVDEREIFVNIHEDGNITNALAEANVIDDSQKAQLKLKSSASSSLVENDREILVEVGEEVAGKAVGMKLEGEIPVDSVEHLAAVEEVEKMHEGTLTEKQRMEEILLKEILLMDPQARKNMLENLAEDNLLEGNKVFTYPQVAQPDQQIQIFFNRSASSLVNEPNVLIMGAFNNWRWKHYTCKLEKSDLRGDWWSCNIHIPKEAYKMDFVFFNGNDLYDNNCSNDFAIPVMGGMGLKDFEAFLVEHKRRELEELAAEHAEGGRRVVGQWRKEANNAAKEADRAQAKVEADKRREILCDLKKLALCSFGDFWYIEPKDFNGQDRIKLFYNRNFRPLSESMELWIHGGYNNWKDGLSIIERLSRAEKQDGDWWYADVVVPDRALILDWVFADGPPHIAKVYDNNDSQDFHAIVPNWISEELYWLEEEHMIYKNLQEERRQKEKSLHGMYEETINVESRKVAKVKKMLPLSQNNTVYTDPFDVMAGTNVVVFYNPSGTVLSGKAGVWLRCSFNNGTHPSGPLPPQKMDLTENGVHFKAQVKVPLDAYMLNIVFSETEPGGGHDNQIGTDYQIPVSNGLSLRSPMHIVHIAVEMAPIAKVGGLGDVVTSLSRAIQELGHKVEIVLPKYGCVDLSNVRQLRFYRSFVWGGTKINVWFGKVEGLPVYFLEPQNGIFSAGIYGCGSDGERFGFFCHAALEFLLQKGANPDILHCHDWSSAPVSWLYKEHYRYYGLGDARVVLTIHNLEFGAHFIGRAMKHADKATTVSPTYSREVLQNPSIAPHLSKFYGILNGIDPDIWSPCNDKFIPISYSAHNVVEGKRAAKEALRQRLGLKRSDKPLVGVVTRLTYQKGIHLIRHAIWQTLNMNGQFVLLGSAPDSRIHHEFANLANQLHSSHGDHVCICLTYDEPLSHLIYAASDFIIIPSIFEPCGLTQLIAMRYGSIPIVRKTGGLCDTVFDFENDKERAEAQGLEPNGFCFDAADSAGVDYALNRAFDAWFNCRQWFESSCKHVMEQDWSWNRPALEYMELYLSACKTKH